jgi:hypothetical protein
VKNAILHGEREREKNRTTKKCLKEKSQRESDELRCFPNGLAAVPT